MTTETYNAITSWGMLALVAIIIGWDVVVGAVGAKTESQIIAETSRNWNIIALAFGILIGHWAWQSKVVLGYTLWRYGLIIPGAVLAFDLLCYFKVLSPPSWLRYPGLWTMVGIPTGSLLWGQRMP